MHKRKGLEMISNVKEPSDNDIAVIKSKNMIERCTQAISHESCRK
jgi:hypothetical protein